MFKRQKNTSKTFIIVYMACLNINRVACTENTQLFDGIRVVPILDLARSIIILRWPMTTTTTTTALPTKGWKKETSAAADYYVYQILLFKNRFYFFSRSPSPPTRHSILPHGRHTVDLVFIFNLLYHYDGATCVLIFHSNSFVSPSKHPRHYNTTALRGQYNGEENKYHYNNMKYGYLYKYIILYLFGGEWERER